VRVTQTIQIQNIDHKTCKLPLNKKALQFAIAMLKGDIFPPISVQRITNGNYKLHEGRHRLAAHKLLGKTEIRANVAIPESPSPDKSLACKDEECESLGLSCWRDRSKSCPDDGDCCNWTQGFPNHGNSYKE
jgi:hypothetical protein